MIEPLPSLGRHAAVSCDAFGRGLSGAAGTVLVALAADPAGHEREVWGNQQAKAKPAAAKARSRCR